MFRNMRVFEKSACEPLLGANHAVISSEKPLGFAYGAGMAAGAGGAFPEALTESDGCQGRGNTLAVRVVQSDDFVIVDIGDVDRDIQVTPAVRI